MIDYHPFAPLVESELLGLLLETARHPLSHFSEKSLQIRLSARLLLQKELSTPLPTAVTSRFEKNLSLIRAEEERSARNLFEYHDRAYRISPLQMEYGRGGQRRIDLAILDPDDIRRISEPLQFQVEDRKYAVPIVGIEFGTEKTGWHGMSAHLSKDADKLHECRHGYSISVMRSANVGRRSLGGVKAKDKTIDVFRRALQDHATRFPRIRWIGVVIHLALGEVECFTSDGVWETCDVSRDVDSLSAPLRGVLPLAAIDPDARAASCEAPPI